jgi:hypothetical protein
VRSESQLITHCTSNMSIQRVAIALNNMGVSLLERGCYDLARETFQDAVCVMKEVFASSSRQQEEPGKRPLSASTLDDKLQKASCNLSHTSSFEAAHNSKIDLCVLTEEESATVIGAALCQELLSASSLTTTFLVRMEGKLDQGCASHLDISSSIILYNYGNAYKCLATTAETAACAKQFCQGAFQLFQLSHSLLEKTNLQDDDEGDLELFVPIMSILILQNLVSFALILGMECEAQTYYSQLLHQQEYLKEVMDLLLVASIQIAAAAA